MKAEVVIQPGLPVFEITGMPELAVRELRVRVRSAIQQAGIPFPRRRVLVDVIDPYLDTANDLPIALSILAAQVPEGCVVLGELSLGGDIRPVNDVMRRVQGAEMAIVPWECYWEARAVCERVFAAATLRRVVDCLAGLELWPGPPVEASAGDERYRHPMCMSDIRGHSVAKRVMEIAAVGGHNLVMVGQPGSGKTMLARRMPGILPPMTRQEAVETSMLHSEAGILPPRLGLLHERPLRAPHHTVSYSALFGGGSVPKPGDVSLAHNGVLFLDETEEFPRMVLEGLREPLEQGTSTTTRARATRVFPAKALVILSMSACPCGFTGSGMRECNCCEERLDRYWQRLPQKVLDSFPLWLAPMFPMSEATRHQPPGETSSSIRARVAAAQTRRAARGTTLHLPTDDAHAALLQAMTNLGVPASAHDGLLRVASSIADLGGYDAIESHHVAEALAYRRPKFTFPTT